MPRTPPAPTEPPKPATVFDNPATPEREDLIAKAEELEKTFPALHAQAQKEGWPAGVSPKLCWGVKRVQLWRASDDRPVIVVQKPDRRCLAKVGNPGQVDGQIEVLLRAPQGGAR